MKDKAFIFYPADILVMTDKDLKVFLKFLNNDFVTELNELFDDETFQAYRDIPELTEQFDNVVNTIKSYTHPIAVANKLNSTPYGENLNSKTVADVIKAEFNSTENSLYLIEEPVTNIDDITSLLEELLEDVIPNVKAEYPRRTKQDWEEFKQMVSSLTVRSFLLNKYTGIPYNKHLKAELLNNQIYLYNAKNTNTRTGLGYLIGKQAEIRIVLNGFKWRKYCQDHNIPIERSYRYV